MTAGRVFPPESLIVPDPASGRRIRQVTSHPSIHHHPFFFVPAYDLAMTRLVFVSYRTGAPQVFFEDRATGRLVQATDRPGLAPWSLHPSPCGRFAYYTAGTAAFGLDLESFAETELVSFGAVEMRERGMVGAAMGTTALSANGRFWAIPVKAGTVSRFVLVDLEAGTSCVFLERDTIGHPQFCPDDDDLILYAGPMTDRVWVTDRSGARNRRAHQRQHRMQWITHETWLPGTREIAFVDWPLGMGAVHADTGAVRRLTEFPAWHAVSDPTATRIVCDTTFPDRGLHLIGADGKAAFLCASEASSQGAHWGGPFPYNDGPVAVEAAQHTHPHPRFSPDGSRIVFTSDRTGHAQIHEVMA